MPSTTSDPPPATRAGTGTAPPEPSPLVSRCPGCGAVLVAVPDLEARHAGAAPACTRLFDVTVRGLRDEAPSDLGAETLLQLATAAYDAQHPHDGDPGALGRLRAALGQPPLASPPSRPPGHWTTTVADLAADLDVVDLPALVPAWAQAVSGDWSTVSPD